MCCLEMKVHFRNLKICRYVQLGNDSTVRTGMDPSSTAPGIQMPNGVQSPIHLGGAKVAQRQITLDTIWYILDPRVRKKRYIICRYVQL